MLVSIGGAGSWDSGVRVRRYITDETSSTTKIKNAHFPIRIAFPKSDRDFFAGCAFISALVALLTVGIIL
jgi:hypothetical protein